MFFDLAGTLFQRHALSATGSHLTLAGIAAGLLAAVPGVVDYYYTVPPESSAKTRATRHAIGNVGALVLFGLSWLLRDYDGTATALTLLFELAGGAMLVYSGWLGGTLVTRNLISVDHRYAGAGQWQEATLTTRAGESIVVAGADDLAVDQMKLLRINGRRLVLARTPTGFTVFDDACTHRGGSLAGGVMIGGTVQCLWHGSQFDTRTGDVSCGPAKRKVRVYEVRETNGQVLLVSPPG